MRRRFVPLLLLASFFLVGCGPAARTPTPSTPPARPSPPSPPMGRIRFQCEPPNVAITVDGVPRGSAAAPGGQELVLPRGLHRFEISLEGYRPYRIELMVGEKAELIRVQLRPAIPAP
jgi:hypothetical protein